MFVLRVFKRFEGVQDINFIKLLIFLFDSLIKGFLRLQY